MMLTAGWLFVALAGAQNQTGGLTGTVLDPLESAVAGASVTLANPQTGVHQTSTTTKTGEYSFAALAPGLYEFTVTADGFQEFSRHAVSIGETPTKMEVRLRKEKEEDPGSVKELDAALAAKPNDPLIRFKLGAAYAKNGELEKANRQFERVLDLNADFVPARIALVQLATVRGDYHTALYYVREWLAKSQESTITRMLAATVYLRVGMLEESRQLLDGLLKDNPNDTDALLEFGILNLRRKQYDAAEEALRRVYRLDPSNMRALEGLAEIHIQKNEPQKAVEVMSAEVDKEPKRRELRRELAFMELRTRQYDKAIADYQALIDQFKNTPSEQGELLGQIGSIYAASGDPVRGIENLKKATQLAQENWNVWSALGDLYNRTGKKPEAITAYRMALKLRPDTPIIMNNLAYLLVDTGGDLEEALRLAQTARQQLPGADTVLDTLGWVYLRKNLTDSAVRIYEDLTAKSDANATYHYHYAAALAQKGDRAAALKQLDLALKNNPGKEEEALIRDLIRKLS
jgi:Flp pilus assembly protein TadD